jgi:hypothetical protein
MTTSIDSNRVEEARIAPDGSGMALGDFVEQFYGVVDIPESMEDEAKDFFRAFFNWFCLVHLVSSGQGYLLDKTQRLAYHMLLDWWSGTYCDPKACVYFLLYKLAPIISRIDFLNDDMRLQRSYHEGNGNSIYKELVKANLCIELFKEIFFSIQPLNNWRHASRLSLSF